MSTCVVAGGGELLDDFRAQAARLGIAERVHFLGAVPHSGLPAVLRAADLLLLTTEPPESFGIVLIEAMAAGLPTIATEYPGVRAVVDEGETGLLVPTGDAGAVAGAIRRLVEAGPSGRAPMGAAGGRRPSASGAGPGCSTAWTPPTPRRSHPGAGGPREPAARRLLLSAVPRHRRPPSRRDGQVAPTAGPPRDGPDDVRVRPADTHDDEGVVRTNDLQRLRARLHGRDRVDALFDSDTYSGHPTS